jgi:hypothetical protein
MARKSSARARLIEKVTHGCPKFRPTSLALEAPGSRRCRIHFRWVRHLKLYGLISPYSLLRTIINKSARQIQVDRKNVHMCNAALTINIFL